jgi:NAD dependent epimerase/dehydratase family enzyme
MENPETIIENIITDFAYRLMNQDEDVISAMTITNAIYHLDESEIILAEYSDDKTEISFEAEIKLAGEQISEKPWCGDKIKISVSGTTKKDNEKWVVDKYSIEECKSNF